MAQKWTKTQWQATGYRAGSWQRWPGVPFLGVHRLKAAGLNLRLGSGSPTCERGQGKPQTMPWARFVHSCILAWEVSLPSSPQEEKLGHEESVSRLEHLGRQVEPRRKPIGEAGKTKRGGEKQKTLIRSESTNENSKAHKEREHQENWQSLQSGDKFSQAEATGKPQSNLKTTYHLRSSRWENEE